MRNHGRGRDGRVKPNHRFPKSLVLRNLVSKSFRLPILPGISRQLDDSKDYAKKGGRGLTLVLSLKQAGIDVRDTNLNQPAKIYFDGGFKNACHPEQAFFAQ